MDKQDITAIGNYLYGQRWQSALARDLGINSRTVRRWAAGDSKPSKSAAEAIMELSACQINSDMEVIREIEKIIQKFYT